MDDPLRISEQPGRPNDLWLYGQRQRNSSRKDTSSRNLEGIYILVDILDHVAVIEDNPEDVERKVTMPVPLIDLHPAANWPQALDEFKKQSDDIKIRFCISNSNNFKNYLSLFHF